MTHFDIGRQRSREIGHCIYCGSTEKLTKEHIVPYSLGGNWTLLHASCNNCAEITKKFEDDVAHKMLRNMRLQLGYRSRHKRSIPKHIAFNVYHGSSATRHEVPIEATPTIPLVLPVFNIPTILSGAQLPPGPGLYRLWVWKPREDMLQHERIAGIHRHTANAVSVNFSLYTAAFCRMLAKIAHAGTIAATGMPYTASFLPDYILGKNPQILDVIGSVNQPVTDPHNNEWVLETGTYESPSRLYLTVKIELFRSLKAPTYFVVVGDAVDRTAGDAKAFIPPRRKA